MPPLTPRALNERGRRPLRELLRDPGLLGTEALAGAVTTLALIPEVISFAIIAGVDPVNALVASVVLTIAMSFLGGRPAMVTAAAGSVALVVAPLVHENGVEYLLPTVLLAGVVQIVFGVTGLAKLMRFIPRSVMIGFVNALGIMIFVAQVNSLIDVPWPVYPLFALTLAIIWLFPKLSRAIPAPLVAIVAITAITVGFGIAVPTVGDEGAVTGALPGITPFGVPLTLGTLTLIAPYALAVAFVGLIETLLTAKLVDDLTDSRSNKKRESWGLGVANLLSGLWGGVAGCAMIGQTVVNVSIGRGRTRLSTLFAGIFLLAFVALFSGLMAQIPMVALAAVMMVVAVRAFDLRSVRPSVLRRMPRAETAVMVTTVVVVVATSNLAIGVGVGVVLAALLLLRRAARSFRVERSVSGATARYSVRGALFFASAHDLPEAFDYTGDPDRVEIDLSASPVWDASSVAVLDGIVARYAAEGTTATVTGLDSRSTALHTRLSGHLDT